MARRLIGSYMGVKPNEEVFIVVDPATDMIMPKALAQAVIECGAEYTIGIMPDRADGEKATTCTEVVAAGVLLYVPATLTVLPALLLKS